MVKSILPGGGGGDGGGDGDGNFVLLFCLYNLFYFALSFILF